MAFSGIDFLFFPSSSLYTHLSLYLKNAIVIESINFK
jgi:hypothetical protein